MKIKILGSGGGEGYPATFCSCAHCEKAREVGGKSLRSLSQTIINDDLLIDFPADTDMHAVQNGLNLGKIENIIITHAHRDHFVPLTVASRGGHNAHNLTYEKLYFWGPKNLEEFFDASFAAFGIQKSRRENVVFKVTEDKKSYQIGKYTVTALTAMHAPALGSLNYVIEDGESSLLYILDSGYPTEQTLAFLAGRDKPFDGVIMDGTSGVLPPQSIIYHMGFEENKMLKAELIRRGAANGKTRFVVNHITHNEAEHHEKIEELFEGSGIEVAYDGYEFEI